MIPVSVCSFAFHMMYLRLIHDVICVHSSFLFIVEKYSIDG